MNLKLVRIQLLSIGLLGLLLAVEWTYGEYSDRTLRKLLQFDRNSSETVLVLPDIPALKTSVQPFNELVERPLFIEGRKPIVEESADQAQNNVENGQIDDWLLIGIYEKDKHSKALFAKKNEAKKYQKLGGEQIISGWTLKEIKPDRVILQQGPQQKTVLLRKPRADNRAPAPVKPTLPKPPRPVAQPPNPIPENSNNDSQKN